MDHPDPRMPMMGEDVLPASPRRRGPGDGGREHDALADLFLGNGSSREESPRPRARDAETAPTERGPSTPPVAAPVIEALVLGHLPVLASIWAGQYARHVAAQRRGPVAMLRVRDGEASVELVGVAGAAAASSLEGAIEAASAHTRHWVVSVDEPWEPSLAEAPGVTHLTLLSGADEAAVVASYRALKGFATARGSGPIASPRIAIMGSGAEHAREVERKLERATETFLARRVEVVACVPRVFGRATATLYRGRFVGEIAGAIEAIASARGEEVAAPVAQAVVEPRPPRLALRVPESPSRESASAASHEADLAALLGLTGLAARCPHAPAVRLAVDQAGALHAIAAAEREGSTAAALADLVAAGAWAIEHRALLQLTRRDGGAAIAEPATVAQHLFSRRPQEARRLVGGPVRVHALVEINVGGVSRWGSAPL